MTKAILPQITAKMAPIIRFTESLCIEGMLTTAGEELNNFTVVFISVEDTFKCEESVETWKDFVSDVFCGVCAVSRVRLVDEL